MPIILRKFQTIPLMQPDGSMADKEYATVAVVDANGQQYSQVNVEAAEVEGFSEGDHLVFALGSGHGVNVPDDHAEMITP